MTTRIYQAAALQPHSTLQLDDSASHHLARVLRAAVQDPVVVFNGQGGEYPAVITRIDKKSVTVQLQDWVNREAESSLEIILAQGISRGEKMDYTIQKAVELGVKTIVPLFTERCNVKLDQERSEKRLQHWQQVIISACEQSGRNQVPVLLPPQKLTSFVAQHTADFSFVLSPFVEARWSQFTVPSAARIVLMIGPEGGLTADEVAYAIENRFHALNMGPRIMRTETAAVAAIAAIQSLFGDM